MAVVGLITYEDASRREDLIEVVTNISPVETPLLSGLGEGFEARQTLHEYPAATFDAAADNAAIEGRAFTVQDHAQPTRLTNITQIFRDDIQVSGTQIAVDHADRRNPLDYQVEKNLKEHAKDIELALMAGSRASGDSNTARRMAGVINGITTNFISYPSGTSFTEAHFNDLLQSIWGHTDMVADEVYVGAFLKRRISDLTAGATRFVAADDRRLVRPVDVYESDFGPLKIFLHRDVPSVVGNRTLVAIRNEFWKISWMVGRRTKVIPLPPDGDRERRMIVSELTLENRGQAASGKAEWRHVGT